MLNPNGAECCLLHDCSTLYFMVDIPKSFAMFDSVCYWSWCNCQQRMLQHSFSWIIQIAINVHTWTCLMQNSPQNDNWPQVKEGHTGHNLVVVSTKGQVCHTIMWWVNDSQAVNKILRLLVWERWYPPIFYPIAPYLSWLYSHAATFLCLSISSATPQPQVKELSHRTISSYSGSSRPQKDVFGKWQPKPGCEYDSQTLW